MDDRRPPILIGLRSIMNSRAIIISMDVGDIRLYKERWKAFEEVDRQELLTMSLEEHWHKLNAIVRFAIEAGIKKDKNEGEMKVIRRWEKLKANYEAGQKSCAVSCSN